VVARLVLPRVHTSDLIAEHQIGTEGGITSAVLITAVVIVAAIASGAIIVAALWFVGALYSDDESEEADFDGADTRDWE
jgi:hypothetical protein